jgi:F-type H+-transporting ATPase subunit b
MEIINNTALISINETLIIQVLSFLIFLFIIDRLMFRPLQKTIGDRERHFQEMSSDIDEAIADVQRYASEMERRSTAVKNEAYVISQTLEAEGRKEADDILDSALKEVSILRETVKSEIDTQISEAKKHVRKESEALAINIMEKVLNRRLSNEAIQ